MSAEVSVSCTLQSFSFPKLSTFLLDLRFLGSLFYRTRTFPFLRDFIILMSPKKLQHLVMFIGKVFPSEDLDNC